ncbi:MAG: hypothetical protein L3J79_07770 [Candidatus Marinimicrobia bacterium]|nr:hypothetical protein [Candidatus Neomarinimicrobiota bacterium]
MAELHPFLVHFPIALILVAFLFDLYGVARSHLNSTWTAFTLQIMAALSALLAAFSGNLAESSPAMQEVLVQGVADSLEAHISMGNTIVWIVVLVVLGRTFALLEKKKWATGGWLFPTLSLALAILVIYTGLLGGALSQDILQYFIEH